MRRESSYVRWRPAPSWTTTGGLRVSVCCPGIEPASGVVQRQGLEPNVITYMAVICAGGLALQYFDEIRQQGLQPNVITYKAVISAGGLPLQHSMTFGSRDSSHM